MNKAQTQKQERQRDAIKRALGKLANPTLSRAARLAVCRAFPRSIRGAYSALSPSQAGQARAQMGD